MTSAGIAAPPGAGILTPADLRDAVRKALGGVRAGARVLAVIPDKTRDDNTDQLFPMIAEELAGRRAAAFDALVAQGTHPPMTDAEKRAKIGAGPSSIITGTVRPSC